MGQGSPSSPSSPETSSDPSQSMARVPAPLSSFEGIEPSPSLILCFGASLTRGRCAPFEPPHPYCLRLGQMLEEYRMSSEELQTRFPSPFTILNRGVDGQTCRDMKFLFVDKLKSIAEERNELPGTVIFCAGTNDLGYGHDSELICESLENLYGPCRRLSIKIVAIEIPVNVFDERLDPSERYNGRKESVNRWMREQENVEEGFVAVDVVNWLKISDEELRRLLWADSLHYTPKGYDQMGEEVFGAVKRLWQL